MSNEKTGTAAAASRAPQPTETYPLDFVPDKMPFDTPYGPPITLDRAQSVLRESRIRRTRSSAMPARH
jgi:glc operon protein GlcG